MKSKTPLPANKRKRHRVAVSVLFNHRVNEAHAVRLLNVVLNNYNWTAHPVEFDPFEAHDIYIDAAKAVRS